jgi:hypothetical protein
MWPMSEHSSYQGTLFTLSYRERIYLSPGVYETVVDMHFLFPPSSCNIASLTVLLYVCVCVHLVTQDETSSLALRGEQIYRIYFSFVCVHANECVTW